jgi:hypothetical protein
MSVNIKYFVALIYTFGYTSSQRKGNNMISYDLNKDVIIDCDSSGPIKIHLWTPGVDDWIPFEPNVIAEKFPLTYARLMGQLEEIKNQKAEKEYCNDDIE